MYYNALVLASKGRGKRANIALAELNSAVARGNSQAIKAIEKNGSRKKHGLPLRAVANNAATVARAMANANAAVRQDRQATQKRRGEHFLAQFNPNSRP